MAGASPPTPARNPAAACLSIGQNSSAPLVTTMPYTDAKISNTLNRITARSTRPPVFAVSATDAMPTTRSEHERHHRHPQRIEPETAKRFDDARNVAKLGRIGANPCADDNAGDQRKQDNNT